MIRKKEIGGFTLIELLIVISIIAMLSALAVASFGTARQRARLDFVADSLVTSLREQQNWVQSGRGQKGNSFDDFEVKCYGVEFQKGLTGDAVPVQLVEMPYKLVSENRADFCDDSDASKVVKKPAVWEGGYELKELKVGEADRDKILILFKPPFAKVVPFEGCSTGTGPCTQPVFLRVGLPDVDQSRLLEFDPVLGKIERIAENSPSSLPPTS